MYQKKINVLHCVESGNKDTVKGWGQDDDEWV
jgi:hypothetical protein